VTRRAPTLPLYVGGFLGPFGGAVLAVLIPQLRDAFDASTTTIATAVPAYLVPFAVLQLVSGTVGERLGRRRVVRTGYVVYALACVASALAPDVGWFLATRALAGAANAFLTPLLLAGLADITARENLGRAVGTFAAVQTSAVALSPLCGGLLGELGWRWAFLVPAGVAVALACVPPPDPERADPLAAPARWRAVLTRRVGLVSAAAFAANAGVSGMAFLVALVAADRFGVGSASRGLVLAGFGVAGMLLGRLAGGWVDRFGRVPMVVAGSLVCALLIAALGLASEPVVLAALWTVAGAGSALAWAGLNTLAVEAVPGNRAGGTSVVGAFKFSGTALAPLLWLPLYHAEPHLAFAGAGLMALLIGIFVLPLRDRARLGPWPRSRSPRSGTPSPPSSTPSATSSPTSPPSAGRRWASGSSRSRRT
jgi:MFS family permease